MTETEMNAIPWQHVATLKLARRHELLLERVLLGDESFRQVCVAGERQCPPEDSRGPAGFAELLKAFQEKDHPEHDYAREWLGDDFASESFNPDEINRRLHRRRS